MRLKKILLISPFFIPRRRVGALRAFRFSVHLKDFGYKPIILTIDNQKGQKTATEERLLKDIPIYSIKTPFDNTSGNTKVKKSSSQHKKNSSSIAEWIDRNTPLDTWIYLFMMRYRFINKVVKETNPDIIWATGDPWSSLWLGAKLAGKYNKPFIADFRDPWIPGDVSLRNRSWFSEKFDRNAEKNIIKIADRLVFTSKNAEKCYQNFYDIKPDKTTTIYNSYSSFGLDNHISKKDEETSIGHSNKLKILFWGRFRSLSPVTPLLQTMELIRDKYGTGILDFVEVHSFGQPDADQIQAITDSNLMDHFIFHDMIPPEKSRGVLKNADIFLVTTQKNRKLIVPAKLWDYLSVDKPILSITPNPEVGKIIRESKAGYHFQSGEYEKAAEYLYNQIKVFKRTGGLSIEESFQSLRDKYSSYETTRQLVNVFDDVLKDGN